MSKSEFPIPKPRRILLKSYATFKDVEKVIEIFQNMENNNCQISILCQLSPKINSEENFILSEEDLILRFEKLFKSPLDFGIITNPEIGTIFIIGAFMPMFLQEINGKKIGSMSMGPYGILRGLGIDQERATTYLKALIEGCYLVIIRGYNTKINQFEDKIR